MDILYDRRRRFVYLEWPSGYLMIGRDYWKGPNIYTVRLGWNDRRLLGQTVPEGEYLCADEIGVMWRSRPFMAPWFWRTKLPANRRSFAEACHGN